MANTKISALSDGAPAVGTDVMVIERGGASNARLTLTNLISLITSSNIALGTPASGTLTNCSGLPISSGVSGLGGGVAAFLATPSSANLATALTDETGSGALVFATSPTFTASGTVVMAGPANKTGQASIVAASGAINTTETVIVQSGALAANRLQAGTTIRIILEGTCTCTVANASTFKVRIGTLGTTSDGIVFTQATTPSGTTGTNNPFRTVIDLTVRTGGASATSSGFLTINSNGLVGIITTTVLVSSVTTSNFDATAANLIISATYISAATTTTSTFQQATIEIIYN